ncbi:MAG: sodium:solute symporter family transporter [Rhodospirillaceae bacterium]
MNIAAITMFVLVVVITLGITRWASTRSRSLNQFYTADGSLSGFKNGAAFTGEFLSAATFLGITGIYFTSGYDGLIYSIGAAMGWPVLVFLLSDRLRSMGQYTLTDVLTFRLKDPSLRIFSAGATVVILLLYMVAQLVGAGLLIEFLFGLQYIWSLVLIGTLMITYVVFGGMIATTWVQIVKAGFLYLLGLVLAVGVLATFDFSLEKLLTASIDKHPKGLKILESSSFTSVGASLSAALTQAVGIAGLPHFIMRFFTVPNVREARRSAAYATAMISGFYLIMIVIGFGTIAILNGNPEYTVGPGLLKNGNNMAPLYLAHALGGDILLGICAATVFATILAVVSALTLAVAAAISHDLYGMLYRKGEQSEAEELKISRWAALGFGIATIALSLAFKNENITFLVVTSLSLAASSTFPVLFLACFWPSLTARGALIGGTIGLVCAVAGVVLGPTVWVAIFGFENPIFPYQYPTIVSFPLALVVIVTVSKLDPRRKTA